MSLTPDHRLEIKCINPQSYTLNAVVNSPRTALPIDVSSACDNLEVISAEPSPPNSILDVVNYVIGEFFTVAHRTGLYNRQKGLWEAISRVSEIEVYRVRGGFFQKKELGQWEIHFTDGKKRLLVYAQLVEPESAPEQKKAGDLVRAVQHRTEKLKIAHPSLAGVFLILPEPCPEEVLKSIISLTGGDDPVGRYELLLPEPVLVPFNLVEYQESRAVKLVLPNLESKARKA